MKKIILPYLVLFFACASYAHAAQLYPNGTYGPDGPYTMAPDGTYHSGTSTQLYPNGSYGPAGNSILHPDGSYGTGSGSYLRPDGSYGSTPNYELTPNGQYVDKY